MTLREYLSKSGETMAAFGTRVGCSHATVSRLVSGKMTPSAKLVLRIERATEGAVRFADFFAEGEAA